MELWIGLALLAACFALIAWLLLKARKGGRD